MPFDSQGNFTRVMNWQEDAANSIPILASRHDDEDDNFANGFNEVMCRDGRTQMTGQLKMGSNKIVGVATGTADTDAVNKGQLDSALAGAVAGKQNTITGGASSITSSNLTVNRALISNGSGKVAVSTTTNTELGYVHGVTSAIQTQIDSKQDTVTGAATTITGSNLTTNRALISNGSGKVAVSNTTSTELGYVHGVTSAIQTQINGKQATITGAATTIASSDLTASRALVSNSSGKVGVSSTTATELGYVHGVTSAIQTQINNLQSAVSSIFSSIYPVGSIYIGTQSTCPLATLISGSTWTKVAGDRVLQTSSSSHSANTTISAGLPNITGTFGARDGYIAQETGRDINFNVATGAFSINKTTERYGTFDSNREIEGGKTVGFSANKSNSIYGNSSTVQPPAYVVNVWRRTA